MKIKNTTSKMQMIKMIEFESGRAFEVFVRGNGTVEIENAHVKTPLDDCFEIVSESIKDETVVPQRETEVVLEEVVPQEVVDEVAPQEVVDEETPKVSEFICDECGAEFASARGLTTHKNKAHS